MKNVWLVISGCIYEGGSVDDVFATEEIAREAALKIVEERNKFHTEYMGDEYHRWEFKETEYSWWENSSDYIGVRKFEVKTGL